jgi:hypothetical protein
MSGKVIARDGSWLELWGQMSVRELTILLALADSPACEEDDCEHCGSDEAELELDRSQVLELRDQLTAWLALGDI